MKRENVPDREKNTHVSVDALIYLPIRYGQNTKIK